MNAVLKIFLSMSFSGSLLILALLFIFRLLKDKLSRQWQYYIWLVVLLRLLLPLGPEVNLLGKTYQAVDRIISQAASLPQKQAPANTSGDVPAPVLSLASEPENADRPGADLPADHWLPDLVALLTNHLWLVWLTAALGLLIRKITIYQSFIQYMNAGMVPVSDIEMLDRLSITAAHAGVKKPVELYINPLISSPLLIGFFHPCIVLPDTGTPERDFQYIVLHELTHYRRRDMFYKWLVQVAACLHWFNPLVHRMSREITRACEFSCDEAVLTVIGCDNAQTYGKTLLDAMAAVGKYRENLGSVTLSENKQLLKERLGAVMNFKKKSTTIRLLTCALTLCIILGATFIGIYSAPSDQPSSTPPINKSPVYDDRIPPQGSTATHNTDHAAKTELPDSGEAPDGKANVETIPVDLETVAFGDTIKLGDYTLSDGDKIYYDISAESGNGIEISPNIMRKTRSIGLFITCASRMNR